MCLNQEIKLIYRNNGLKLKKKHIKQIYDKRAEYNWLKGKSSGENLNVGKIFLYKYLKEQQKLRFFKQPKLAKIKYQSFFKDIEINYPNQINQEHRNKENSFLNESEKERWKAHLKHPLINQTRIKKAKIVVFGLGGIGSNVLLGLTYGGVHKYKIVDHDRIEASNLNRQTLYIPNDIGKLKCRVAEKRLLEINPKLNIKSYNLRVKYPLNKNILKARSENLPNEFLKVDELIKWGDIIVNALDYYGAPFLINDLCIRNHKPYYWAICNHSFGEIFSFIPEKTACLRCIFGPYDFFNKQQTLRFRKQNTETTGAVLSSSVIITGNVVAGMIISDICNLESNNHGKYIILDVYKLTLNKIPLSKYKKCEC
ncbi:MAG: ThiF family adenylyltransferase [Promethearchaeota archaeon]